MVDDAEREKVSRASSERWACQAVHISPHEDWPAVLYARENSRLVELVPTNPARSAGHASKMPAKRGEVTTFSRPSRRRLLCLIAKIDETVLAKALFLTLTYPKNDPTSTRHACHLDSLLKRLSRHSPESSAVWKLEWTKSGTPHYHLLILNCDFWDRRTVAKAWAEIVSSEHPDHERAGTRIEKLCVFRHAAKYITKYVSKTSQPPAGHRGRIWGKSGPIAAAFASATIFALTRKTLAETRRLLDKLRLSYNRKRHFRRAHNLDHKQTWFLTGKEVIRYLTYKEAVVLQC